jgi:hypothetical protein
MTKNLAQDSLAIFETYKIRRVYDEKKESWYFSVIDIIAALIDQKDFKKAKSYWTTLKNRLKIEGSEFVTKCDKLKMQCRVSTSARSSPMPRIKKRLKEV